MRSTAKRGICSPIRESGVSDPTLRLATTRYILFYFADSAGIVVARLMHHARDTGAVAEWPQE